MNAFYWKLITDIATTANKNEIKENVFVFRRIVETYPCSKCTTHFKEYTKKHPLGSIQTKNEFISYIMEYKRDVKKR